MADTVLYTIIAILEANGFIKMPNGDMFRTKTGCSFKFETLQAYTSVLDFQIEWGYSFPDEPSATLEPA